MTGIVSSFAALDAAERELGAFLSAISNGGGFGDQTRASNTWIDVFESQYLPDSGFEKFFRNVTILALKRLQEHYEQSRELRRTKNLGRERVFC